MTHIKRRRDCHQISANDALPHLEQFITIVRWAWSCSSRNVTAAAAASSRRLSWSGTECTHLGMQASSKNEQPPGWVSGVRGGEGSACSIRLMASRQNRINLSVYSLHERRRTGFCIMRSGFAQICGVVFVRCSCWISCHCYVILSVD